MINEDTARTLSILREMAKGKFVRIHNHLYTLTDDMFIAIQGTRKKDGEIEDILIPLQDMTLWNFNNYLNLHKIGHAIPKT